MSINPQGYNYTKAPINRNPFWGGEGGGSNELWYPTVDNNGNISWQKSESDTPPTTKNIKGEKGDTGENGVTPSITVNATVAPTAGTPSASVTKSGTDAAPVFNINFSGLKGETGAAGATGPQGPQGIQGTQGPQGPQGAQGVAGESGADGESAYQIAVNNGFVGTEEEWLASLVGPQGPQGPAGESSGLVFAGGMDFISHYNPSIDKDIRIQANFPVKVVLVGETEPTDVTIYFNGVLNAYGTANPAVPISAIPVQYPVSQIVPCVCSFGGVSDLPFEDYQVAFFMFNTTTQNPTMWTLNGIIVSSELYDNTDWEEGTTGNIYYDERATLSVVGGNQLQSNPETLLSGGATYLLQFTVPDFRDNSVTRIFSAGVTIPAIPPAQTNGPWGTFTAQFKTGATFPAYGDDPAINLSFAGELVLSPALDNTDPQNVTSNGKYIIQQVSLNYYSISSVNVTVYTGVL